MNKNKIYHKFFIVFVAFVALGGVYFYFSNSLKSEASLVSSLKSSFTETVGLSEEKISTDIDFIGTLTSLNEIKIDTSLFTSKAFKSLKDNTVNLESVNTGRLNPFAPVVTGSNNPAIVSTDKPTDIKNNGAILNGVINNPNKLGIGYFEYGSTKELGQKTTQASASLMGTFVSNVTGLDSKKTYFYKACAKINAVTFCGDIVSFETN